MTHLFDMIDYYLGDYLVPRETPIDRYIVRDYIQSNKRIIVNIENWEEVYKRSNFFYHGTIVESTWANTRHPMELKDTANMWLTIKGGNDKMFETSFTITPDISDIILSLVPCLFPDTLLAFTAQVGGNFFESWIHENQYKHLGNILIV
ncbi:hypothetical protein WA158_005709, partial [Blastocystis sp. Blastoise]